MTIDELKAKLNGWFNNRSATDRAKMRKYVIVFPAMIVSFLVCMWLIFGSGFSKDDADTSKANMELPEGDNPEMSDSKLKAMENQAAIDEKAKRDSIVQTLPPVTADSMVMAPVSDEPSPIESSAQAYQEVQASLNDFFVEQPAANVEMDALNERIAELEAQNAIAQQQPDQMEMLERSYQLAAQYMGNGNAQQKPVVVDEPKENRKIQTMNQVQRNVVSSLTASASSERLMTSVGKTTTNFKNTVSAVIASDQSVTDGQMVKLRTTEPMWVGNSLIPKNTQIVGSARLQGERLEITIENIEALGCIMEVDISVYDSDGSEGINIPNSMESDALHEIGANMGSTMGSSINISTDAGAQIASDVGRGLINGVSQYLTKKMRTVKVHLKAGYKVMLKQNEQ